MLFKEADDSLTDSVEQYESSQAHPFLAVGVGGIGVAVLDTVNAILVYSLQKPILVLQTIASGK